MSTTGKIILAAGLAAVVAGVILFLPRRSSPKGTALGVREQAMEMLGVEIAKLHPGSKVLVLSNPFASKAGYLNEKSQFERAGIHGLRKGLGSGSKVEVVCPEIRPEFLANPQSVPFPADCRTPLSFLMQPASVDQLAEAHPDCGVVVSLIGLPVGVDRLKLWSEKDPRSFALLLPDLSLLGSPAEAAEAFQRGKLVAAVVEDLKSGVPFIVTRGNVAEVLQQQPRVLGF